MKLKRFCSLMLALTVLLAVPAMPVRAAAVLPAASEGAELPEIPLETDDPAQTAESAPPAETAPAETAPAETAPAETAPAETAPAETAPAETTAPFVTTETVTTAATASESAAPVTTVTESTETTEQTTTLLSVKASVKSSYPGGDTALRLTLKNNPGLEAIGLRVRLPEVLRPVADTDSGLPLFEKTEAMPGENLVLRYNSEQNLLSLTYAGDPAGAAQSLLLTVPLHIAEDAVIDKKYTCKLFVDSVSPADRIGVSNADTKFYFKPVEPLLRACPETLTLTEQGAAVPLLLAPAPPEGSCTWESDNPEAVTVDAQGNLTAVGCGSARITISCETRTYYCDVTCALNREITPSPAEITEKDGSLQLTLSPQPVHPVEWSSTDEAVAAVAADGTVTAKANGRAVITAKTEDTVYSITVRVHYPCTLSCTDYAAEGTGDTLALTLSDVPENAGLLWESSDPKTATVSEDGLVTFAGEGEAEISVTWDGETYVCHVVNLPYLRGDLDGDGVVDLKDANHAMLHYNEVAVIDTDSHLSALAIRAGDVDKNGTVDLRDATSIMFYYNYTVLELEPDWEQILRDPYMTGA